MFDLLHGFMMSSCFLWVILGCPHCEQKAYRIKVFTKSVQCIVKGAAKHEALQGASRFPPTAWNGSDRDREGLFAHDAEASSSI